MKKDFLDVLCHLLSELEKYSIKSNYNASNFCCFIHFLPLILIV